MAKASDNPYPSVLLVEQASAPATPAAGQARLYRGTDNKNYIIDDAGVSTEVGAAGSETFTTYTPVLTAATTNPTLGTGGSISGRYYQNGKHVEGDIVIQFGTSGANAGSGTYLITLPVAASTAHPFAIFGSVYMANGSTLRTGVATRNGSTQMQMLVNNAATSAAVMSSSVPAAWTNNDVIIIHFSYEAA